VLDADSSPADHGTLHRPSASAYERTYPSFGFVTPQNMGLMTDLYELVMIDSYLRQGLNEPATFDLFIRGSRQPVLPGQCRAGVSAVLPRTPPV